MAFCRLEEIADVPDLLPEGIDGPDGSCAEMGFKLCEGHFDRIEVRAIGWQEQDPCAPGLDGFLGGLALVGLLGWKKLGLEESLGTRLVTYADDLVILGRRGSAEKALHHLRAIMGKQIGRAHV